MPDIVYYVASSLDGFIAHEDGSFAGFEWDDQVVADFVADQEGFGTVLMGRKTYEVGLREGKTSPYPSMRQIVLSRTLAESPDPAVELKRGDVVELASTLKDEARKDIWICGGSEIATPLLAAGIVDRVVVKLNPVIFGSGIPLFGRLKNHVSLRFLESKEYACGIVFLTYAIRNESA